MDPSGVMRSSTGGASSATPARTPPRPPRVAADSPLTGGSRAVGVGGMGGKITPRPPELPRVRAPPPAPAPQAARRSSARAAARLRAGRLRERRDRARAPADRRAGRGDGAAPRLPGHHPGERFDLPLPHGGGGPGRASAAAGDAAPLQLERPGPPRAVPPNRAAHPGREQGDARRDCPLALLRTAPRAGATPDRDRKSVV